MQITERPVGGVTIVDVSGKITLGDGDIERKDKLRSLVQQKRKQLLLNLANVSYVDSAGLGAIVHSYATVKNQGGSLKLLNVTKRLQDLLSITKLLAVFETFENEAEALRTFTAGAGAAWTACEGISEDPSWGLRASQAKGRTTKPGP